MLPMPKWPERESTLLKRLQKHEGDSAAGESSIPATTSMPSSTPGEPGAAVGGAEDLGGPRLVIGAPPAASSAPAHDFDLLGDEPRSGGELDRRMGTQGTIRVCGTITVLLVLLHKLAYSWPSRPPAMLCIP